jgi:DNA topoisomerase-1
MSETLQAYCMKCKTKRTMVDAVATFSATGVPMTKGVCEVCGTGMSKMGETPAHAGLEKPAIVPRPKPAKAESAPKKKADGKKNGKSTAKPAKRADKAESTPKANAKKKGATGKAKNLVIVESPAKARTVGNFLGKEFTVLASKGHVRDLLVTQLSVDVENDFEPKYRVPNEKRDIVKELKRAVEASDRVYLATDPDREGEAIAWHLMAAAEIPQERAQRVVFHEITNKAIQEAFSHARDIDDRLVNAQQARRILDRLVGYNITELLWEKVRGRLSAGRVQSVALRIVVDREREIEAFVSTEYWTIDVQLATADGSTFVANLVKINDQEPSLGSEEATMPHVEALRRAHYQVSDYKVGTRQRKPSPPFTTSTLQQEASRRLGFNATRTMRNAQDLYEGVELDAGNVTGLITYMRTDSLNVSTEAQAEARDYVRERYGASYLPDEAPKYKTKARGAQEAHEAIRPTSVARTPAQIKPYLTNDQYKLYKLIWERFMASQMTAAVYDTVRVEVVAGDRDGAKPYLLRASGSRIKFNGFLVLYEDAKDEDSAPDGDEGRILPNLQEGEALTAREVLPEQHFTQPPPRYTEASLVRTLEEYGIGRPSTYAPTVAVIQDREYVTKVDKRLVPTETGKLVSELLVQFFPEEMDYQFTAKMEDRLDEIADGDGAWKPMLRAFYTPFQTRIENARTNMPVMKQEESTGRICPTCNEGTLLIKYGRWGKFLGCSNYPTCNHTEPFLERIGILCPKCGEEHGGEVIERKTKRGRTFYGCSRYPACDFASWELPQAQPTPEGQEPKESA